MTDESAENDVPHERVREKLAGYPVQAIMKRHYTEATMIGLSLPRSSMSIGGVDLGRPQACSASTLAHGESPGL